MRRLESWFQLSSGAREVVRTFSLSLATATTRIRQRLFAPDAEDGLPGGLLATTRGDADQRGCSEEFVPTNYNVGQLQVVQQYLSHAHEDFRPFHSPVVAPYRHLKSKSSSAPT